MTCAEKITYLNHVTATAAAERLGLRFHCHFRVYACHECPGWHLTSAVPRPIGHRKTPA